MSYNYLVPHLLHAVKSCLEQALIRTANNIGLLHVLMPQLTIGKQSS